VRKFYSHKCEFKYHWHSNVKVWDVKGQTMKGRIGWPMRNCPCISLWHEGANVNSSVSNMKRRQLVEKNIYIKLISKKKIILNSITFAPLIKNLWNNLCAHYLHTTLLKAFQRYQNHNKRPHGLRRVKHDHKLSKQNKTNIYLNI
jgi:hypothetical protein